MAGKLYFKYGAMNSSKSTRLIMDSYGYEEEGQASVIAMKPKTDTKGGELIISRTGLTRKLDIWLEETQTPSEEIEKFRRVSVLALRAVFIDEAQFLQPWQVDDLLDYANENPTGADVLAYGLRTDFRGELFPGSARLFEVAETVESLKGMCGCGTKKANFNARQIDGVYVFSGGQVAIDGKEETTYKSLCVGCYQREVRRAYQNGAPIDESSLSISGITRIIGNSVVTTTDKNES